MRPADPTDESGSQRLPRVTAASIALLIAAFALATHVAPPAASLSPPPWNASAFDRLFPGVPAGWIVARLSVVFGVFGLAIALSRRRKDAATHASVLAEPPASAWPETPRHAYRLALAAAIAPIALLPWAGALPRALQILYLLSLAAPAVILAWQATDHRSPDSRVAHTPWVGIGIVTAIWLVWRVPGLTHSPLVATPVDSIMPWAILRNTLGAEHNLLTDHLNPGFASALSLLQGAALFGMAPSDVTPGFMQGTQVLWTVVAAALLGWVSANLLGRHAATVAAAVFLFSPYTVAIQYLLGALFLGALMPMALMALWIRVARRKQPWALAAFGTALGLTATHPALAPLAAIAALGMALHLRRCPQAWGVAAIGLLGFCAAILPGLPNPSTLTTMTRTFASAKQMWAGMEAAGLGLVPPALGEFQQLGGQPGPFDNLLSVAAAPWATPRTPLRLWGDVFIEPLGAALFAAGLGLLMVLLRRSSAARQITALVAFSLLPALISSYDRPSLTRAFAAPVLISLVAGIGFRALELQVPRSARSWLAAATGALIILSGVHLFDFVQPRILARSSVATAMTAIDAAPGCVPAAILIAAGYDVQNAQLFAAHVPRCPIAIASIDTRQAGAWLQPAIADAVVFWSPGLEDTAAPSATICAQRPSATLWQLFDDAGIVPSFAAHTGHADWRPPAGRVAPRAFACGEKLPTERSRAEAALAGSLEWIDDPAARVAVLRSAAASTFVQSQLYTEIAAILRRQGDRANLAEAHHWAWRAAVADRRRNPTSSRLLAELQLELGMDEAARTTLRAVLDNLRTTEPSDDLTEIERLLQRIEAAVDDPSPEPMS